MRGRIARVIESSYAYCVRACGAWGPIVDVDGTKSKEETKKVDGAEQIASLSGDVVA